MIVLREGSPISHYFDWGLGTPNSDRSDGGSLVFLIIARLYFSLMGPGKLHDF